MAAVATGKPVATAASFFAQKYAMPDKPPQPNPASPAPVEVVNVDPLVVKVAEAAPTKPSLVTKGEGTTLSPKTTEQEDIVVGRQAEIGKIWEWTQSILSVLITIAVIYAELTGVSSVTLGNAFFFVVSLYLIRTNHQKIGGEGPKATDNQPYRGR